MQGALGYLRHYPRSRPAKADVIGEAEASETSRAPTAAPPWRPTWEAAPVAEVEGAHAGEGLSADQPADNILKKKKNVFNKMFCM